MIGVHTALSQAGRAAATGAAVLLVLATGLLASCGGAEDPGTARIARARVAMRCRRDRLRSICGPRRISRRLPSRSADSGLRGPVGPPGGVIRTRVGYTGGTTPDPTYESLGDHTRPCNSTTIRGDQLRGAADGLLREPRRYLRCQPSAVHVAIFYHDAEQEDLARQAKAQEEARLGLVLQTKLLPAPPSTWLRTITRSTACEEMGCSCGNSRPCTRSLPTWWRPRGRKGERLSQRSGRASSY